MSVGIFNAETSETKDVADKSRVAILDDELDENSNNAVKNKVITQKIAELNQSIEELNTLLNGMDETLGGKLDVSKIANNLVTTEEGYALDARMGKALYDAFSPHIQKLHQKMVYDLVASTSKTHITISSSQYTWIIAKTYTRYNGENIIRLIFDGENGKLTDSSVSDSTFINVQSIDNGAVITLNHGIYNDTILEIICRNLNNVDIHISRE